MIVNNKPHLRFHARRCDVSVLSLLVLLIFCYLGSETHAVAQAATTEAEPTATSDRTLDASTYGFPGLSPQNRFLIAANVTLNFLDSSHLLFTFNQKKLFQRLPECPPTHKDRVAKAVVIEVATGRVVRETTWYLHDDRRYLWPLGNGHFLLRRMNALYDVDGELHEKLLLDSPRRLLYTSVTPDGKQIIVETESDDPKSDDLKKNRSSDGSRKTSSRSDVKIDFLDSQSLAVQRTIRVSQALPLTGTSLGFADAVHSPAKGLWLIRFGSDAKDRNNVTRIHSRCVPDLQFPTNNTIFIGRCSAKGADYSISVFTVTGHFLWRERWPQSRYFPAIERSEDSSRVAISTVAGTPGAQAPSPDTPADEYWPENQQLVRVVDSATGTEVLSTKIHAGVVNGQDFTLSPDASQFVLLDGSRLEFFHLPAMTQDQRAKFLAAQADTPALAAPTTSAQAFGGDEEVFDVAAQGTTDEAPSKAPSLAAPPQVAGSAPAQLAPAPPAAAAPAQPAGTSAAPSPSPEPADGSITFRVSSKTVVVDVVVTDAKGHLVKGLTAQDFHLQEDGKPQAVNYFHEFRTDQQSDKSSDKPAAEPANDVKLPPNVFANNQLARDDQPVTVFLLDLLNTPVEAQTTAREQLIKFLKNQPRGSQFALCTLSNGLRLIQGFTDDETLLLASVNGKKGGVRWSPLLEHNKGLSMGTQMQQEVAAFDASKQFVVQMFEQASAAERNMELDQRVSITVDAFEQLARYLAGVPGRKNVVWLSATFPLGVFPNTDLFDAFSETRNYEAVLKKTANLLAEAHVAVYPVDVRGLMTQSMFAASSNMGTPVPAPGSLAPIPAGATNTLQNTAANADRANPVLQNTHESLENQIGDQSTMEQIAADTGGKAFYNTNDIAHAIQAAVDQGSAYYMLSYTPSNRRYDGKFRKIKVELDKKGYHLAHRKGYFADDPLAPAKEDKNQLSRDVGLAAMQHGSPQSHQILFATRVVPVGKLVKVNAAQSSGQRPKKNQPSVNEVQRYAVDYAIAGPQLRFIEQNDVHHGVLNLLVAAFDDEGRALSRLATRTTADLKDASYRDAMVGGFRMRQEFDVPAMATSLRLGVEDELSRNLGTVEIPLPVPPLPDEPSLRARRLPPVEPD